VGTDLEYCVGWWCPQAQEALVATDSRAETEADSDNSTPNSSSSMSRFTGTGTIGSKALILNDFYDPFSCFF
jgi:hypothetical protein